MRLHLQPIVDRSFNLYGYEVFVRPLPAVFTKKIDEFIVKSAVDCYFSRILGNTNKNKGIGKPKLFVNVSHTESIISFFPDIVIYEISEKLSSPDINSTLFVNKIAIDDFPAENSLEHIFSLGGSIDYVKIDMSLVKNGDTKWIESFIRLVKGSIGKSKEVTFIAEGVETEKVFEKIKEIEHIKLFQGFYIDDKIKPLDITIPHIPDEIAIEFQKHTDRIQGCNCYEGKNI